MRTTLNLPLELLEGVRKQLGFTSKTDTVIFALQELKRRKELKALIDSFGSVDIAIDLDAVRERPKKEQDRVLASSKSRKSKR